MSYANATITERQSGRKLSSEGYSVDCRFYRGSTPGLVESSFLAKLKEGNDGRRGGGSRNDET